MRINASRVQRVYRWVEKRGDAAADKKRLREAALSLRSGKKLPSNPGLQALGSFKVKFEKFASVHYGACHRSRFGVLGANFKTKPISVVLPEFSGSRRLAPFLLIIRAMSFGYFALSAIELVEAPVCLLLFR